MSGMDSADFAGMTVNERLFHASLLDAFDAAAKTRDRVQMIALLTQVALPREEAERIADTILASPAFYGY